MRQSDEIKAFETLAESFAERELTEKVSEYDRYPFGGFFNDVVEKAYRAGFLGVMLPAEFGGAAGGIGSLCAVLKAVCRVDASLGGIIFTSALVQEILAGTKAEGIMQEIYAQVSSVKESLVAFPIYHDPSRAEDLPQAELKGEIYALSGKMDLVALGGAAAHGLIPAHLPNRSGLSFFLVDMADPGIVMSPPVMTLGLHACPAVDVSMEKTKARLIGGEGGGRILF